jgi:hypothetical protein
MLVVPRVGAEKILGLYALPLAATAVGSTG